MYNYPSDLQSKTGYEIQLSSTLLGSVCMPFITSHHKFYFSLTK